MGGKRHSAEQIIAKLRAAELGLAKGQALALVVRKLGSSSGALVSPSIPRQVYGTPPSTSVG